MQNGQQVLQTVEVLLIAFSRTACENVCEVDQFQPQSTLLILAARLRSFVHNEYGRRIEPEEKIVVQLRFYSFPENLLTKKHCELDGFLTIMGLADSRCDRLRNSSPRQ